MDVADHRDRPVLEGGLWVEIGQGTGVPAITDELLAALLEAYRAARANSRAGGGP